MTTTVAVLLEPVFATITGVAYTSDNCLTALDKVTATNESGAIATATVQLLSSDGSQIQSFAKAIAPSASWPFPDVVGHVLASGGKLNIMCPTPSAIKVRASGRQFT
jgi:hypothetical protein